MITIQVWNATEQTLRKISAEDLIAHKADYLDEPYTLWVDLCQASAEEEQLIFEQFYKLHTLSLEDVTRPRREPESPPHLPKVEEFRDYLFVIVNPLAQQAHARLVAEGTADGCLTQLSAILIERVLITHHYLPLRCVDLVHDYLARHEAQLARGPDYLFHLVLDNTVDEFVPVLDGIEETLDRLETTVVREPRQESYLSLLRLKRVIITMRKTLIAEREVLVRLARGEFALIDPRETAYYRNVYDHLVRFTELIESSREMVSDLMQTYLTAQSNHLNQIMKVLTMISTIVLPMTLISGIYGMNVDLKLPGEHGLYIALGLMLASGLGSIGYFWWKRWL